jgi:hypothetical protein
MVDNVVDRSGDIATTGLGCCNATCDRVDRLVFTHLATMDAAWGCGLLTGLDICSGLGTITAVRTCMGAALLQGCSTGTCHDMSTALMNGANHVMTCMAGNSTVMKKCTATDTGHASADLIVATVPTVRLTSQCSTWSCQ